MHLYQGSTRQFIADATQARLANQLSDRFFDEFRYRPSPSEVLSWRNSLGAMATVLQTHSGSREPRPMFNWTRRDWTRAGAVLPQHFAEIDAVRSTGIPMTVSIRLDGSETRARLLLREWD